MQALRIPADENSPTELISHDARYATLAATVDDTAAEMLFVPVSDACQEPVVLVTAANGKQSSTHDRNSRATQMVEHLMPGFAKRDHVAGAALLFGIDDCEDLTDVPAHVIALWHNHAGLK